MYIWSINIERKRKIKGEGLGILFPLYTCFDARADALTTKSLTDSLYSPSPEVTRANRIK